MKAGRVPPDARIRASAQYSGGSKPQDGCRLRVDPNRLPMTASTLLDPRMSTGRPAISEQSAWSAVLGKDARWDGRFVYGVTSTGIFCRPSCPSRRPRRENVRFFAAPVDAEAAGFRACRRCSPAEGTAPTANAAVLRARQIIDAHPDTPHTLTDLGRAAGLSPTQLQRAFTRTFGVSPRAYQDSKRIKTLKVRLRDGATVSRATFDAGFGSSSRVYERATIALGMTPGEYRRGGDGAVVRFTIVGTPLGRLLVAATDRGVCAVSLGDDDATLEKALREEFHRAEVTRDEHDLAVPVRAIVDRLQSGRGAVSFPLDVRGTAFQQLVWRELQRIPEGETRTYAQVAQSIGKPSAARAVARACAANRLAIAIPCHRVVRGDGAVGGYRWGVDRKKALLEVERSENR
jgi:AraC family transcriptional regulator, regulatory protein of adaptative response / methylated-DNA-[protein]-cysteine methyltransferase